MQGLSEEIFNLINSLTEDKKLKITNFIKRESEMGGKIPSLNELKTIISYLNEAPKKKENFILSEKQVLTKSCAICRFNDMWTCSNPKSELYEQKIFASIMCAYFEN